MTKWPKYFQNSNIFETGLSDFHELTFTVLKAYFQKQKPKVIIYRSYKKFDNNLFRNDLLKELLSKNIQTKHLVSFKATAQYIFDRHDLRNQSNCNRSIPCTESYGIETASSIGAKLWDKVPTEIKNSKSLEKFKVRIKIWVPKNCPCKICKLFIKHVGYI